MPKYVEHFNLDGTVIDIRDADAESRLDILEPIVDAINNDYLKFQGQTSDLNTALTNGRYQVLAGSLNSPNAYSASLIVFQQGSFIGQLFSRNASSGEAWYRTWSSSGNAWSEWLPLTYPNGLDVMEIAHYYIDCDDGLDTNSGSNTYPLQTIDRAFQLAKRYGKKNIYIHLKKAGDYPTSEQSFIGYALHMRANQSGTTVHFTASGDIVFYSMRVKLANLNVVFDSASCDGIYSDAGFISYEDCTFDKMIAGHGGAIYVENCTMPCFLTNRSVFEVNGITLDGTVPSGVHYVLNHDDSHGSYKDHITIEESLSGLYGFFYCLGSYVDFQFGGSYFANNSGTTAVDGVHVGWSVILSNSNIKTALEACGTNPRTESGSACQWFTTENVTPTP